MTERVTPNEARQGRRGYHVLTILIVSLVLMAIFYGLFELIWR